MKKLILGAALLLAAGSAFAADTIKATVGHMCCGSCKASATAGLKTLPWADTIAIDAPTVTVTAKPDQHPDIVGLMDALNKAGFPASEILVSGPVTLHVAHLCCGGCVAGIRAALASVKSPHLDPASVKIDQETKTVTLSPMSGQSLNLVPLLHHLETAGFAASQGSLSPTAVASAR